LKHEKEKDSAELMLKFEDYLNKPEYVDLISALDTTDINVKIFRSHGGPFSDGLVEDYMGEYETIDNLYTKGLIDIEMIRNSFSYNLEQDYLNKDIQSVIAKEQKEDTDLWSGFQHLGKMFKEK